MSRWIKKFTMQVSALSLLALVVVACNNSLSSTLDKGPYGYTYQSLTDTYKPESWRPKRYNATKRPPTRKENWKNYKVGNPYVVLGKKYYPKEDPFYNEVGIASWYGPKFHNKLTANGEIFDRYVSSAAHKTLPMPSVVKVTNLKNGRAIRVRVNDRGPFAPGRIIDLSERAAEVLGFKEDGLAKVRVEFDRKATASLFYNASDDAPSKPMQRVARHHTSPRHKTVEARFQAYDEHFIQTGAYSSKDSARTVAVGLRRVGPVRIEAADFRGKRLYRVKLGPFKKEQEAGNALEKVAQLGFNDAIIVSR